MLYSNIIPLIIGICIAIIATLLSKIEIEEKKVKISLVALFIVVFISIVVLIFNNINSEKGQKELSLKKKKRIEYYQNKYDSLNKEFDIIRKKLGNEALESFNREYVKADNELFVFYVYLLIINESNDTIDERYLNIKLKNANDLINNLKNESGL